MSEIIPIIIGIDGGSTKTAVRMEAVDGSWSVLTVYDKAGTNLHAYNNTMKASVMGPRELDNAIHRALTRTAEERDVYAADLQIEAMVIGTAGIDSPDDQQYFQSVFKKSRRLADLAPDRLQVVSDVLIINSCGVSTSRLCLIAGTGSNCYAWRRLNDGWTLQRQVGGLDLPLSDNGSAAWIGLKACQRALFLANTQFGGDDFAAAVYEHLGINNLRLRDPQNPEQWRMIKQKVEDMHKRELAAICEHVVVPLADAGNQEALTILRQAGEDLADMAAGAIGYIEAASKADSGYSPEIDPFELLLVGGVWKDDRVFHTFLAGLAKRDILNTYLPRNDNRVVDPTLGAIAMARALLK